jgi:hypothetical protein
VQRMRAQRGEDYGGAEDQRSRLTRNISMITAPTTA